MVRVVGEAGIEPTTPSLEGSCSIQLSYSPARVCIDCSGKGSLRVCKIELLAESKILASQQRDDRVQRGGPVLLRRQGIVTECLYVKANGESLLWASEINQSWTDDAVKHGIRVIQRGRVAREPMHHLLHLVVGGEERSLAPEDIDVADEA